MQGQEGGALDCCSNGVARVFQSMELVLARFIGVMDARALDLDFRIMEKRADILVLATSFIFTGAATAMFANPLPEATEDLQRKISQDIVDAYEIYYKANGLEPATYSMREIARSQERLDGTLGWDTYDHLLRYHEDSPAILIESFWYLSVAVLCAVLTYLAVVVLRISYASHPSRFPLCIIYYAQLFTLVFAIYGFIYGTVQITRLVRWRLIFNYSSPRAHFVRMRLQDSSDPFIDEGTLRQLGWLIGGLIALLGLPFFANSVESIRDWRRGRKARKMFVGSYYMRGKGALTFNSHEYILYHIFDAKIWHL